MSTVTGWDGTIKQLRFDPTDTTESGTFRIGFVRLENSIGGILKSWDFSWDVEGWTANANVDDFRWLPGDLNLFQSANYVPGVSGWAIKGNGLAEFWNINIYGTVPAPKLYVGGAEVTGGAYVGFVDVQILASSGTTAYYRTDGQVPSGDPSEAVPVSGIVNVTSNQTLIVIAFEDSTNRPSDIVYAPFTVSLPLAANPRAPVFDQVWIRSYIDIPYCRCGYQGDYVGLPSFTSVSKSVYYNLSGIADGFVYKFATQPPGNDVKLVFYMSNNWAGTERVGRIFLQPVRDFADRGIHYIGWHNTGDHKWRFEYDEGQSGDITVWDYVGFAVDAAGEFYVDDYPYL
jgi:hypothetical protein